MRRFLFPALLVVFQLFTTIDSQAATRYVSTTGDDTANDCLTVASPCATIQYAVDQAVSDDTIDVGAGTYNELVVTGSKTLTFLGAQRGIDARSRNLPAEESILDGAGLGAADILLVEGSDSVVDGFTFQNGEQAGLGTDPAASGYQVINNIFQDNLIGLRPGCDGAAPTLVQFNRFQNNGNQGIYVDSGSKNITVDNNSFVDNLGNSMNFSSAGGATNADVTITNNEITGSVSSLFLQTLDTGTISGNVVTDHDATNTNALFLGGGVQNLTVTENIWSNGPGIGIHVSVDFDPNLNQNIMIHQNNISNFPGGCLIVDPDSHVGPVDATDNYWDCVGGPGVPDCTGDATCEPALLAPFPKTIELTLSASSLSVEGIEQITVTGTLADGTTADVAAECTFTSSDPSVAEVDNTGLVTGINPGTTTITASCFDGQFTNTATVQVTGGGVIPNPVISGGGCALVNDPTPHSPATWAMLASLIALLAWKVRFYSLAAKGGGMTE